MRFSLYPKFGAKNSEPIFSAVAQGLARHGHQTVDHDDTADVAVIWSQLWAGRMRPNQLVFQAYRNSGRPVLVVEVGALKRNLTWRLLLNGQHRMLITGQNQSRCRRLNIDLAPWRTKGRHIIVACQRTDSNQWAGLPPFEKWLKQTVKKIHEHTDRPVLIRPHPRSYPRFNSVYLPAKCHMQMPMHIAGTYDNFDFENSIQDAWAVVNWNSNPGTMAVVHGIPAFVGPSSAAAAVANLDFRQIETPHMPDRQQWFNDLAWTEWSQQEIADGLPFDYLESHIIG